MAGYKDPPKEYQWKPGQSGNPGGRPKGGLKDYDRKKFVDMTNEEKEKFLERLSPELRYRMAEGNPAQDTDITSGGEKITFLPSELQEKYSLKEDEVDESSK